MLRALYYPFSRCIDASALKQLLLVFDSVTFLDPVGDDEWRAKLFRDLEKVEDQRFGAYRTLEKPLITLRDEGAIVLRQPETLAAFRANDTSAAALADLSDAVWCDIAKQPAAYNLPYQTRGRDGRATWQIFPAKVPSLLREKLHTTEFERHVIWSSREDTAWTVSYEAGSAASLNLHLAAAGELSLAPVTDSSMHHRLLLRKLVRSLTPQSEWVQPTSPTLDAVANHTAFQLIEQLVPQAALEHITFESILRFREDTHDTRAAMVSELKATLTPVAKMTSPVDISALQQTVTSTIAKELQEYRASLLNARDKLWPGILKSSTFTFSAGTAGAVLLQYLIGGPAAVLAGSVVGASLGVLATALEQWADEKAAERRVSSSVAYLSQVSAL